MQRLIVAMLLTVASNSVVRTQDSTRFGIKGTKEFGGSIAFQSFAPVTNGKTGDALTSLSVAPYIGWFLSDRFELGFNPFGFSSFWFGGGGGGATTVTITAAPSYNFISDGRSTPFIEGLFGVLAFSSTTGYSYGGRAGLKNEIAGHALLNIGAEYLATTVGPGGPSGRNGTNLLLFSLSLTAWY